ncbi:MAG: hypothetical protein JEZ07_10280 [Phycisphaerae bacterium]|nr:hypothetical protein [Phycisphaerae bacterium]
MLIKRILKRTLKVNNHKILKVVEKGNKIEVHIDVCKRRRLPCGTCGTLSVQRDRPKERRFKHVPLWDIAAVQHRRTKTVKMLLPFVKNPCHKDHLGRDAMQIARENNYTKIIKLLVC